MQEHHLARAKTLRQRIAAATPGPLRKCVRMVENYANRHRMWLQLLLEVTPEDSRSRAIFYRSMAAAPLTALAGLDSFQSPRLLGDIEVSIPRVGQISLRSGTDDVLNVLTARDSEIREVLETRLPQGGTFIDAGANIGFYSLLAARKVGPRGRVVAFEMMPDTAIILRRHVERNATTNVEVVELALSDCGGETVIASVEPGKPGQASIVAAVGEARRSTVEVATTTLDEALAKVGAIDLLKMDLEGAEFLALSGASAVLARTRCVVFESNSEDCRIFTLLDASGFEVRRLEGCDFVAIRTSDKSIT